MTMDRRLLSAALALLLLSGSGCALRNGATAGNEAKPVTSGNAKATEEDKELHLRLVREMLDKKLYHAALAHLQAVENQGDLTLDARYLRAEALRRIGRLTESRALYRSLLDSGMAGLAHHGLGLIAAENNDDLEAAILHFRTATELRPVDSRIRNDLGYALLLEGAFDEARFQLNTAMELGGDEQRTERNLLLLLMTRGDLAEAERFAAQAAIDPAETARLRGRALQLRTHLQRQSEHTTPAPLPQAPATTTPEGTPPQPPGTEPATGTAAPAGGAGVVTGAAAYATDPGEAAATMENDASPAGDGAPTAAGPASPPAADIPASNSQGG
jgi:Flp pilus assembly protein TadD